MGRKPSKPKTPAELEKAAERKLRQGIKLVRRHILPSKWALEAWWRKWIGRSNPSPKDPPPEAWLVLNQWRPRLSRWLRFDDFNVCHSYPERLALYRTLLEMGSRDRPEGESLAQWLEKIDDPKTDERNRVLAREKCAGWLNALQTEEPSLDRIREVQARVGDYILVRECAHSALEDLIGGRRGNASDIKRSSNSRLCASLGADESVVAYPRLAELHAQGWLVGRDDRSSEIWESFFAPDDGRFWALSQQDKYDFLRRHKEAVATLNKESGLVPDHIRYARLFAFGILHPRTLASYFERNTGAFWRLIPEDQIEFWDEHRKALDRRPKETRSVKSTRTQPTDNKPSLRFPLLNIWVQDNMPVFLKFNWGWADVDRIAKQREFKDTPADWANFAKQHRKKQASDSTKEEPNSLLTWKLTSQGSRSDAAVKGTGHLVSPKPKVSTLSCL
jgi:hypothetical protein